MCDNCAIKLYSIFFKNKKNSGEKNFLVILRYIPACILTGIGRTLKTWRCLRSECMINFDIKFIAYSFLSEI